MRRPGRVDPSIFVLFLLTAAACDAGPPAQGRSESAIEHERAKGAHGEDAPAASLSAEDVLYAASSVVRVVEHGRAGATIALRKTVSEIAFDREGARAFLAASDGVHVVDARTHRDLSRLTETPARSVVVSAAQGKLYVLDHSVITLPDGHAEPQPFHVRRFDLGSLEEELDVEVGQRMLAIGVPSSTSAPLLVVSEAGTLVRLRLPSGAAEPLSAAQALGGRVRLGPVLGGDGRTIYLPVEGPEARIAEIDTETGSARAIRLGRDAYLRGLAVSPDGETLYINALDRVGAVDLASSALSVRWATAELPAPHQGLAVSPDGARLYLARPVHDGSGSITVVDARTLETLGSVKTPGISPFTVAVRPARR
jgi:hypothetical protein